MMQKSLDKKYWERNIMSEKFQLPEQLVKDALEYHRSPTPGKTQVVSTKPVATQQDLSLAYTPGVAAPCNRAYAARAASLPSTRLGLGPAP